MAEQFLIAALTADATEKVVALYRAAAQSNGGLARAQEEIDAAYVRGFLERAQANGVSRAAFAPDGTLAAEIHALRMAPRQFAHMC